MDLYVRQVNSAQAQNFCFSNIRVKELGTFYKGVLIKSIPLSWSASTKVKFSMKSWFVYTYLISIDSRNFTHFLQFGKIDYHPHLQIIPQNPWTLVTTMPHKIGDLKPQNFGFMTSKMFIGCCMLENLCTALIFINRPKNKIWSSISFHNYLHNLSHSLYTIHYCIFTWSENAV